MNAEENLIHTDILRRFRRLVDNNRLAHAYLLVGPPGSGKSQTVLALVKSLNCQEDAGHAEEFFCNRCSSCRKINAAHHPDVHIVRGSLTEGIKIDDVREILKAVRLKPFEASQKIFLIQDVEYLTTEAANTFLKTLEEPPANSILFLTTSAEEKVLDTIRSRCHALYFYPLGFKQLAFQLRNLYDLDKEEAFFLSSMADGSFGQAVQLKKENIFVEKKLWIKQFFSTQNEDMIKEFAADKIKAKYLFYMLLSWLRDALFLRVRIPQEELIHQDSLEEVQKFAQSYNFHELAEMVVQLKDCYEQLEENLNIKLPLLILQEKMNYG